MSKLVLVAEQDEKQPVFDDEAERFVYAGSGWRYHACGGSFF